jgi:hypothetical protein
MRPRGWLALLLVAVAPATAAGQELARRVSEVETGTVRLAYPTRPGVEICDEGVRIGEQKIMWRSRGWDAVASNCRFGPAEVELRVRGGTVRGVEMVRRLDDRTPGALDLGVVDSGDAVRFLLQVARGGGRNGRGEEDALFPAVLADVDGIWRDLMALARDRSVDEDVRGNALFWVGQEAADSVTAGLTEVAMDDHEDQDVREAAVFALSQRPDDEAVPMLMEIARTARQIETRRSAMFWLAQSGDERVYAFFERILTGGGGS